MIGTLFSLVLALFLWFHPVPWAAEANKTVATIMIAVAIPFLFFIPLATMWAWMPLQKAEQNSTPRIMELFRADSRVHLSTIWLVIFSLLTFAAVIDLLYVHAIDERWLMAAWIIMLGLAVDAARHYGQRVLNYLNPFSVVKMFSSKALKCIQNDKEIDLCHWIDALSEVAVKGIERHSTSVSNYALEEEQNVARLFLSASKSIGHPMQDKQSEALGITDKVSFTLFYLYQRLDQAFEKALKNKLESTCNYIITLLGKICIDAAKYDVSLASVPLRFLGKLAKKAQDAGFEETVITASCTFSEVSKAIINDIDITYYQIKDPFLSIINGMEMIAKGAFQKDKTMNIDLLVQPFKELKALFETDKVKDHQDTPIILQNINRVLGEFEALQLVMTTIPPIPNIAVEEETK